MTERFMMKNRPPREPGVCYSLGGRPADPNEKPQKRPFSLVLYENVIFQYQITIWAVRFFWVWI